MTFEPQMEMSNDNHKGGQSSVPRGRNAQDTSPAQQQERTVAAGAGPAFTAMECGLAGTRARRLLQLKAPQILQPDTSVGQTSVSVQGEEGGQGDDVEILGEACAEECYHWWLPTLPRIRDAQRTNPGFHDRRALPIAG